MRPANVFCNILRHSHVSLQMHPRNLMNRFAHYFAISTLLVTSSTGILPVRGGTEVVGDKSPAAPAVAAASSPKLALAAATPASAGPANESASAVPTQPQPATQASAASKPAPPALPAPAASSVPAPAKPAAPRNWEDHYSDLLKKYASSAGVRYAAWKNNAADVSRLREVVNAVAAQNLSGKSRDDQLAFYLNAYNAWILQKIIEAYPVKGPGNGNALKRAYFFKSKSIEVAGQQMSFSGLENDIIRPRFKEPRIHFALNCASASCPPLQDRAFRATALDRDLTLLTRNFVNGNPRGVQFESGSKKVRVSKIFDWYGDDFEAAGGLIPYINRFRATPIPASAKVSFMDYDWSLNENR